MAAASSIVKMAPSLPPVLVVYSSSPTLFRGMENSTESRQLETLFLLTDNARDKHLMQLLEALPHLEAISNVVRHVHVKLCYDNLTSSSQKTHNNGQKVRRPSLPWHLLRDQYYRIESNITAMGRTSLKLEHRFWTVPKSQAKRDFNRREQDRTYDKLEEGEEPGKLFAVTEGTLVFIQWHEDEHGRRFLRSTKGPLQEKDKFLVVPSTAQFLCERAPERRTKGQHRPDNAFRVVMQLRVSDKDELGHVTNSRYAPLVHDVLTFGLQSGYYANGSGPDKTSSSLPTIASQHLLCFGVPKTVDPEARIAVPAGKEFYKRANVLEFFVAYENELKVKPQGRSPKRARKEQDMSYLQRPTIPKHHYPPQPPLNTKFERPKTRAHASADMGSDAVHPVNVAVGVSKDEGMTEPTEQQAAETCSSEATQDLNTAAPDGVVEEPTLEQQTAQGDATVTTSPPNKEPPLAHHMSTSDALTTTPAPTAAMISTGIAELTSSAKSKDEAPKTMPNTVIPAQIALINASPSKRVAFSPNKQESTYSIPNRQAAPVGKLKGILKLTSQQGEHDSGQTSKRGFTNATTFNAGDSNAARADEQEPFVQSAVSSLESADVKVRETTYFSLLAKLRASDLNNHLYDLQDSIRIFASCLTRDLNPSSPSSLIQSGLKFLGYCFFNQSIVAMFTAKEIESLIVQVLDLINNATEKPICNLAVWSLASAKLPSRCLAPFLPQLIQTYSDNLDSRFKSLSIMNESLVGLNAIFTQYPTEIVPHVQTWLIPVIMRLIYHVPGIRSKALDLIMLCIPKLIEKDDTRRQQVSIKFMKEHCADFVETLTQNFVKSGEEVYAITVWGALVTILGKVLQKHPLLNKLLKMAEFCFNTASPRRGEIKMATFQAWTRLIYNFAIGGHIASEKPLRLMLTPMQSCFSTEKNRRVRLASANAWIALIYALGPKLPKNAEQVLFPQLKVTIVDDSQHVRDIVLRLLTALFSNAGGDELELVEGRQHIVPGTISFTDPGWYDPTWVRAELLDNGLDALYTTITMQHKITNANQEQWRLSGLTGLPLITHPCARVWESIVRAVRDINQNEKGMKATEEAERAVCSLLLFIERISHCNPKQLVPGDWLDSQQKEVNLLLKRDPEIAGYILRADIVHYLYVYLIETFSVRSLVTTRYKVQDKIHADVFDALSLAADGTPASFANGGGMSQTERIRSVMISPLDFILKCWLATGESIIGSAFETSFWQAVATLVDMSKSGRYALRALYKCLEHMEDIRSKRLTSSSHVWPAESHTPVTPLIFREFECKYWSIIAQRLGTTINEVNEISEDATQGEQRGYKELFNLLVYPFGILLDPSEPKRLFLCAQYPMEKADAKTAEFITRYKSICMPTWTDLLRNFYRVAQHKRGDANVAMNGLALEISMCFPEAVPSIWSHTLGIACASAIIDTVVLYEPKSHQYSQAQGVLLAQSIARSGGEQAYRYIEIIEDLTCPEKIPAVQDAAFLMMEKLINKAPLSLLADWIRHLQDVIVLWLADPLEMMSDEYAITKSYQARIDTFWTGCILPKVQSWSSDLSGRGARSAFGSVESAPITTIRGAYQPAQNGNSRGSSPIAMISHPLSNKEQDLQDAETLALLKQLLTHGFRSGRRSIARKTSEAWIQVFGSSDVESVDSVGRQKQSSVWKAPISVESQTQTSASGSQSQDALSVPVELNMRPGISKRANHVVENTGGQSPSRKNRQLLAEAQSPRTGAEAAVETITPTESTAALISEGNIDSKHDGAGGICPGASSPLMSSATSRYHTSSIDSDSSVQSSTSGKKTRKRKRNKTVHSLALDPINKSLVAQTSEKSASNTPEGSSDEVEHSTPSKRARKAALRRERKQQQQKQQQLRHQPQQQQHQQQLPAPPVWRLQPPLKPYDPAEDLSPPVHETVNYIGCEEKNPGSNSHPNAVSVSSSREVSPSPSPFIIHKDQAPTRQVAVSPVNDEPSDICRTETQTSQSQEIGGVDHTTPLPLDTVVEPATTVPNVKSRSQAADIQTPSLGEYFTAGSEQVNSMPATTSADGEPAVVPVPDDTLVSKTAEDANEMHPESSANVSSSGTAKSIDTGKDFANTVGQLVEARELVNTLDMRQLVELQNQLVTLQQAVCGVWNHYLERDPKKNGNEYMDTLQ
ncbi:DNA-binding protein rif1 [Mortierella sp. GBA30]|nr:DNA-binding protein rif1 [Mortierella sp. GBA30]